MTTAETVAVMDTRLLNQNERLSRLEITVAKMTESFHPRISDAELTIWQLKEQIEILTAQIAELRETQKQLVADSYRHRQVL